MVFLINCKIIGLNVLNVTIFEEQVGHFQFQACVNNGRIWRERVSYAVKKYPTYNTMQIFQSDRPHFIQL